MELRNLSLAIVANLALAQQPRRTFMFTTKVNLVNETVLGQSVHYDTIMCLAVVFCSLSIFHSFRRPQNTDAGTRFESYESNEMSRSKICENLLPMTRIRIASNNKPSLATLLSLS